MIAAIFTTFRLVLVWFLLYLFVVINIGEGLRPGMHGYRWVEGVAVFGGFALALTVLSIACSHVLRVRLVAGKLDASSLSARQRRQVEIPFEAGEAFDLVDAAVRELPGAQVVESARDSLQVRAKVKRIDPYGGVARRGRNQVLVTVTPNLDAGSALLVCEPERPAWTDWFLVDHGTNLENAEAIVRAITRRVADRRRGEQDTVRDTVAEKELAVARLSLLQAQVEPHFLYNTLANAQLLTRSDPPLADQMLGNLIQYLRHSLPRGGDGMSTLGQELERTRAYLDILKIRMGSRLSAQLQVDQTLALHPFPSMMLQTLVENAIKHGLEPKPGGGTVWVLARVQGNILSVTVADDGMGLTGHTGGSGIGLANVRERLRLAYGDNASFVIGSNFPSGVAATIQLPYKMPVEVAHA
jgi:signal transduction histidine kinase